MNARKSSTPKPTIAQPPLIRRSQQYRILRTAHLVVGITAGLFVGIAYLLGVEMSPVQVVVLALLTVYGAAVTLLPAERGLRHFPRLSLLSWGIYQGVIIAFSDFGIDLVYVGVMPVLFVMIINGRRVGMLAGVGTIAVMWFATLVLDAPWFGDESINDLVFALLAVTVVFTWFIGVLMLLLWMMQQAALTRARHQTDLRMEKREAEYRGDMLKVVATLGQSLLQISDWRLEIEAALQQIGEALNADRVALLPMIHDDTHGHGLKLDHLWQSAAAASLEPALQPDIPFYFDDFALGNWLMELDAVQPIRVDFSEAAGGARDTMAFFGSQALVILPIFGDHRQLWGVLGADRVHAAVWTDNELDALTSLTEIISAAIQRRYFEEQQVATNNRLRALLNAIPDSLLTLNLDGEIQETLTLLEGNREVNVSAVEYHNVVAWLSSADVERLQDQIRTSYQTGSVQGDIFIVSDLDTSIAPLGYLVLDVRSSVSAPEEVLLVVRDITAQHQLEEQRRSSEAKFRALYENSPDVIALVARSDGHIIDINPAVQRLLGFPQEQLVGQHYRLLLRSSDERGTMQQAMTAAVSSSTVPGDRSAPWTDHRREVTLLDASGHEVPVDVTLTALSLGEENYILVTLRDVSHRVQMDALAEALEMERELYAMQSTFVETVSHQFRTPLTIIQLSTEILRKYGERLSPDKRDHRYNLIAEQVSRLEVLLENVLQHSEARDVRQLEPQLIDVRRFLADEVAAMTAETGKEPRVMLRVDDEVKTLQADPRLLSMIVRNPLENALAYAPEGPVFLTASIQDNGLLLKTADTGIGIPEEMLSRVFEPFQRGANVATTNGSGLGLTTTRRAVLRHQGQVSVQSTLNKGTTLQVWLPLAAPVMVMRQPLDLSGTASTE
jgi:PAS domain S-box-containing protein